MNQTLDPIGDELLKRVYHGEQNFTEEELELLATEYDKFDFIKGEDRRWLVGCTTILNIEDKYFSISWDQGLTEGHENEYDCQPKQVNLTKETKTITVNHYNDI